VYYHPLLEGYDEERGYAVCKSFAAFLDRLAGKTGRAPAWVAAMRGGDLESVRQWLDDGGDAAERYDGRSAVELAARNGKLELVQFLVGRGAELRSFNDRGESALHRVVYADDDLRRLAKMRLLIDAGLELHARHFGPRSLRDPSKRLPAYSVAELMAGLGDREGLAELEAY